MADTLHGLMGALGHREYLVAGGDWGAHIGSRLGGAYPDAVRALHLYMLPLRRPDVVPGLGGGRARRHWRSGRARRAATPRSRAPSRRRSAYGLFDSPVGLMSWIAEKFESWTDALGVPRDDVLTTVMIYWVTRSIGTSFWPYYARLHGGWMLDDVVAAGEQIACR